MKYLKITCMLVAVLGLSAAKAQTYVEYNAPVTIANGTVDEYSYIVMGPNAVITIEQDWYVMTQDLYIHPSAQVTGPGTLHIMDPATFGNAAAGVTTIDGGGAPIHARVSIENPNNVTLSSINPNAIIAGLGWTDPGTAGTDHLVIDNTLNFGAAGGDVLLNNSHVVFAPAGTYSYSDLNAVDFPGTDPAPPATPDGALLVTNGTGHVIKQSLAGTFKFPVGIGEGDYTPATVSGASGTGDFVTQVKAYSQSAASVTMPAEGMDRSWHIYSNTPLTASLALQHNTATNGALYTDAPAFVTQYQGSASWSTAQVNIDYTGAGDIAGSAVHTHTYVVPGTEADNGSFFTKTSDAATPLPVTWVSFDARLQSNCSVQLSWVTASEQNSAYFAVERSIDGRHWMELTRIKAAGTTSFTTTYSYADEEPVAGLLYYRIRQADVVGKEDYSVIKTLQRDCGSSVVKVYPTLNHTGVVYVSLPAGYEQARLRLFDSKGQVMNVQMPGNGRMRTIYLQSLPKGNYILQLQNRSKVQSFKVAYLP